MQGVLVWSLARELRSHMLHSMAKKEMKRNIFYYQGQRPSINVDTSLSWQELVSWPFLDTGETENCIPWHSTHCLAAALLWKGVWIFGREPVLSITLCCVKSLQLCLTLCNPVDCRPPSFSVHGILQARTLEWFAMPSSRRSSWPSDQTCVSYISCIGRRVLHQQHHLGSPLLSYPIINSYWFYINT